MISQRRAAQLGLAAAALVMASSFAILAGQRNDAFENQTTNAQSGNQSTAQSALPMAVSLSARSSSEGSR